VSQGEVQQPLKPKFLYLPRGSSSPGVSLHSLEATSKRLLPLTMSP